jgi:DNA uptake protein ComE-like DNA-binding protein
MKAFVVGLGLGAIGGLLFAPKRGELTHADPRAGFQKLISTASERIEERISSQDSFEFTKKSSQSTSETEDRKRSAVEIINSATRESLIAVHGIGEVLADRIIERRPYQQAYEVVEKGILPESTFVQLRRQLLDKIA